MATTVGEASIKLSFDSSALKSSMMTTEAQVSASGTSSGSKWANAWSVTAGNLIAKAAAKIGNVISQNLDKAISRADTLANFPKVMQSLGYAADEASSSISTMSDKLDGLPTSLDDMTTEVQQLAAIMGNLNEGAVNATNLGLALNDMFLAGGQGTQAASSAMEQYNQMLAVGKVDMQSWKIIMQTASGQLTQLAKDMLGSEANAWDLYYALQEGTISFDDMNAAIVRLDNEGGNGFDSFSNQAIANTQGVGTALENVQNRVAKAIEKIISHIGTERIAAAIDSVSSHFADIADALIPVVDFIIDNTDIIFPMVIGFITTLLAFGLATKIASFFSMIAANPIILIIAAVIAGVILLLTHLEEVKAFFQMIFSWIVTVFQTVANFIIGIVQNVINFITGIIQTVVDFITMIIQNIVNFISGIVSVVVSFFSAIWEGIKTVLSPVIEFFAAIWNGIVGVFSPIVEWFTTNVQIAWDNIVQILSLVAEVFQKVWDSAVKVVVTIFEAFAAFFKQVFDVIKTIIEVVAIFYYTVYKTAFDIVIAIIQKFAEFFSNVFNAIKNVIETVANFFISIFKKVYDSVSPIIQAVLTVFQNVFNAIKNVIQTVVNFFVSAFQTAANTIRGIFQNIYNFFVSVFNKLKDFFGAIGQAIADGVSGAFKAVVNGLLGFIEGFLNTPIRAINGLIDLINMLPGVSLTKLNTFSFPRLAEGGVALGGTMAMIGESGREAVLPLDRNTDNWSGLLASALVDEMRESGLSGSAEDKQPLIVELNLDGQQIQRVFLQDIRRSTI